VQTLWAQTVTKTCDAATISELVHIAGRAAAGLGRLPFHRALVLPVVFAETVDADTLVWLSRARIVQKSPFRGVLTPVLVDVRNSAWHTPPAGMGFALDGYRDLRIRPVVMGPTARSTSLR